MCYFEGDKVPEIPLKEITRDGTLRLEQHTDHRIASSLRKPPPLCSFVVVLIPFKFPYSMVLDMLEVVDNPGLFGNERRIQGFGWRVLLGR